MKQKALGRGIDLHGIDLLFTKNGDAGNNMEGTDSVALSLIDPNPKQPRTDFDPEALEELADSIRALGIIQPVTLRPAEDGRYIIVSGERRCRAARMAGLESVPAYVRQVDDQRLHEMALVENIQRQDLNAMEVAVSLQRLIDECGLTQEALSQRVGKKRSTIANYLRLLKQPAEVQIAVREGAISMGHAKALAGVEGRRQVALLRRCLKNGLSVRQTEQLAAGQSAGAQRQSADSEEYPESYLRLVEHLEQLFTQNIAIRSTRSGKSRIIIEFNGQQDVEKFLQRLEKTDR